MQLPTATGYGHGQSMLQMGLWMAPMGVAMMAVSPLGAKITRARGPRTTLVIGALIVAAGYALSTAFTGSLWGLALTACLTSAGVGIAYGAMPALIMATTPPKDKAAANGFNSLMRSIGTTMSAAVIGVVLAQLSVPVGDHTVPTLTGFRVGLLIACGVAVLAALLGALTPRHLHQPSVPDEELLAETEAATLPVDGGYLPDEDALVLLDSSVSPGAATSRPEQNVRRSA